MNSKDITYPQKDRWAYLWLVIGTVVIFFWRMPLAWWLSPIFLLRFVRTQNIRRGFFLIWVSGFLMGIPPMYNIVNALIPTPLPVFLIIVVVFALMNTAVPYLVDRLLTPRLKGFSATLVFPLIVTTTSYIAAKANPAGSIGGQAYFQYSNLAFIQILSITGMWGIVFLVNWLGPVVNYAWERSFSWKEIRGNVLIYAAIMLAVLLYGGIRLAYAPQASETVRVHGFTAVDMRNDMMPQIRETKQQDWQTYRQLSAELQDLYLEGTIREAQAEAQIVHWPEMAVNLAKEDEADFLARGGQIAQDENIYLVAAYAAGFEDGSPFENKLVMIDPAGEVILEHHKYGGALLDGAMPGDGILRTVETPYGTISGIICNDTYHEEIVTQAGRNGTDLLFSPTMGYRQTDPLQAHMAMYRAIENGVTHVRMADNGLSFAVDPYGRVSATMDHWNTTDRVMVAQVPLLSTFTLYPYIGDLFAWLAIAGFLGITTWAVVSGRREKQKKVVESK